MNKNLLELTILFQFIYFNNRDRLFFKSNSEPFTIILLQNNNFILKLRCVNNCISAKPYHFLNN